MTTTRQWPRSTAVERNPLLYDKRRLENDFYSIPNTFAKRKRPQLIVEPVEFTILASSRNPRRSRCGRENLVSSTPEDDEHSIPLVAQETHSAPGATVRPGARLTNDSPFERRRIERVQIARVGETSKHVRRRMNSAVMIYASIRRDGNFRCRRRNWNVDFSPERRPAF